MIKTRSLASIRLENFGTRGYCKLGHRSRREIRFEDSLGVDLIAQTS
jgi:hypothetical protein